MTEELDNDWVRRESARLSNWGRWGPEDQYGAWNNVTPETNVRAAACVRRGKVFSLALPFGPNGPSQPGRPNALHFMTNSGSDIVAGAQDRLPGAFRFTDDWVLMNLSCSTQWDGFPHVFQGRLMYNGVDASAVTSRGARRNAITELADKIVTRGVLLDLPRAQGRSWLEPGEAVLPEHLDACCAAQGVEVGAGDAVLVRTGAVSRARAEGGWADYAGGPAPGLSATTAAWFRDRDVSAAATDTWAFEVFPAEAPGIFAPLHQIILCHCGVTIGEMFDLDELAADCAADGVYECLLVAPPLPLEGAANTPVNPQAIK